MDQEKFKSHKTQTTGCFFPIMSLLSKMKEEVIIAIFFQCDTFYWYHFQIFSKDSSILLQMFKLDTAHFESKRKCLYRLFIYPFRHEFTLLLI